MSNGREVGEQLVLENRFVLEEKAGSGGMGEVYKALDRENGARVAIKVMREGLTDDASRFTREARILAELNHPHIVRHIAHGFTDKGTPWMAMEWLEGEDLSARLAQGRLPLQDALHLTSGLAEAVGFAHSRGIVHRDLKPSNVFLVGKQLDHPRILDFGIARTHAGTHLTRTGMLIGTPAYMAPEQARGEADINARADVYSLGCLLFECLTGSPVFSSAHIAGLLAKILFEDPPRLRDKIPAIPKPLDDLAARMLAKYPQQRPENGQAVALALKHLGPMQLLAFDVTLEAPPPAPQALTGSEQRSVAVILIGPIQATREKRSDSTLTANVTAARALASEAEQYGGHCEVLLDGSVAVVLTRNVLATDLAAQAARLALSLRTILEPMPSAFGAERSIALAMGRVGSTERLLMDQAIDRAAKLCSLSSGAKPPILLDEVVAGLLDARFDVRESEAGFVLRGERELAEGTRTLLGKATPCVGREKELRFIEGSFEECLGENAAQVVLVTAPAGVGKSRLGQEFLRTVRDRVEDFSLWIARGDSLRAGSALGMLGQALRTACDVREGEPLERRRRKIEGYVAERAQEADQKRIAAFVGEIVGTPFPDEDNLPLQAARVDAQLMGDQMRAAFLDFVALECERRPVIMLLEDLHWSDRSTIQFLDRALRDLGDKPLFLLALSRPEVHEAFPGLWAERKVLEIRLKELNRKAIERLVRHVLGEKASVDTVDRIARLSEGNAFYLEELIRFAAEGKDADLPQTVVAMVQSRLGALDDVSKRVLRAASIFGEVLWTGGVASLLGGEDRRAFLAEQLGLLAERELLVKRGGCRFSEEEEFAFRHALLREGAYAMLTEEDRALGHRLAGEWLEAHGEDDALLLAEHFEKGKEPTKAAQHYLRASIRAFWSGDSLAAIANARRGLDNTTAPEQRIPLLGAFCEGHFWHIDLVASAVPQAEELSGMAARGSAPWAQAHTVLLNGAQLSGQVEKAKRIIHELVSAEPTPEGTQPLLLALSTAAIGNDYQGNVRLGDTVMARMTDLAEAAKAYVPGVLVFSVGMRGTRAALSAGDPEGGFRDMELSKDIAMSVGHRRFVELFDLIGGMNLFWLGAYDEAERKFLSLRLPDEEFAYVAAGRRFCYAWMLADRGSMDEARKWASQLVASGQARRLPLDEGRGHWILAEVLRRAGELDAAHAELGMAESLLRMVCPLDIPGVLATRAAAFLLENKREEALASAGEGMGHYRRMEGCSPFFRGAFLHLVYAECLEALGRLEEARAEIRDARAAILSKAAKIQNPVYRKNFLEDVPENRRTLELVERWLGDVG